MFMPSFGTFETDVVILADIASKEDVKNMGLANFA